MFFFILNLQSQALSICTQNLNRYHTSRMQKRSRVLHNPSLISLLSAIIICFTKYGTITYNNVDSTLTYSVNGQCSVTKQAAIICEYYISLTFFKQTTLFLLQVTPSIYSSLLCSISLSFPPQNLLHLLILTALLWTFKFILLCPRNNRILLILKKIFLKLTTPLLRNTS